MHTTVTLPVPSPSPASFSSARHVRSHPSVLRSHCPFICRSTRAVARRLVVAPAGCGKSTIASAISGPTPFARTNLHLGSESFLLDGFPSVCPSRTSPPVVLRWFLVTAGVACGPSTSCPRSAIPRHLARTPRQAPPTPPRAWCLRRFTSWSTARSPQTVAVPWRDRAAAQPTVHLRLPVMRTWRLAPTRLGIGPPSSALPGGAFQRRPQIELDIVRCQTSAWRLFAPHHYLNHALNRSAVCLPASWRQTPVASAPGCRFSGQGPRRGANIAP